MTSSDDRGRSPGRSRAHEPITLAPELDEAVGFWLRRSITVTDELFAEHY